MKNLINLGLIAIAMACLVMAFEPNETREGINNESTKQEQSK